jgi:hypothetical protein
MVRFRMVPPLYRALNIGLTLPQICLTTNAGQTRRSHDGAWVIGDGAARAGVVGRWRAGGEGRFYRLTPLSCRILAVGTSPFARMADITAGAVAK